MIPETTIDEVRNLDIIDVIGRYITLVKKGASYKAKCPFHNEKTSSFSIQTSKGIFKCFGCGKGGDAIHFVMAHEKLSYYPAIEKIAKDHNIAIPQEELSDEAMIKFKALESLRVANGLAKDWFVLQLAKPENAKAMEYLKNRWDEETIAQFQIGFAPDSWYDLKKWAEGNGLSQDIMIEAGLLQVSKERVFDTFRNRIMFPIFDKNGRTTGFTGRDFSEKTGSPKYFNSKETAVYHKEYLLYGLNFAKNAIRELNSAILVEGNADVIKMHQIGKANTVATCGTSLTQKQIDLIASLCSSVTIIGDSDGAGLKSTKRSAELLNAAGLFVSIVPLPWQCPITNFLVYTKLLDIKDAPKPVKSDPDSFFNNLKQFDKFSAKHSIDYIIWKVEQNLDKANSPELRSKLIDNVSKMISLMPENTHEIYAEKLGSMIKPKSLWTSGIKSYMKDSAPAKEVGFKIPENISLNDFEKYGFYQDANCYYFKTKAGVMRGTNFIMEPLFHISSVLNAKRLYKITNEFKFSQVIELPQKDLIGLSAFRLRIESLGNFLFEASETELNKLKRYLYEKTESCFEIEQLGWQKQGFWAWCNGIYDTKYTSTDINGIVKFNDINFYLPASSNIYLLEDTLFVSERRFKYLDGGKITLNDYAAKLMKVYGVNAMYGICFYMASLFRDHIIDMFRFFPVLNLFGPKGAGKTELAVSLMQFFGPQSKGPNMTNTTRPALADHVAMFSNSLCHIDEYKNSVEYEKIEFLKGLWDGTGRTRMNMDKDRKKETSHVDCGIMLTGQEMPTADIALFSRLVFLSFSKVEYSDEEKVNFNALKEIEKLGLTHITHGLLSFRKEFLANFELNYNASSKILVEKLQGNIIEDRIFRNWLILLATYSTLKDLVPLPFTEEFLFNNAVNLIMRQNSETKKSNELSIFWHIVEFLSMDGLISEEVDYKLDCTSRLKTDTLDKEFINPVTVLYINHSRLFQLYRVHGQKTKENILPLKTLEYYLQHSPEYLGKKASVAFKVMENGKVIQDIGQPSDHTTQKQRKVTTAMAFDYSKLSINLSSTMITDQEDLPF